MALKSDIVCLLHSWIQSITIQDKSREYALPEEEANPFSGVKVRREPIEL
jgi:hypothetical protein